MDVDQDQDLTMALVTATVAALSQASYITMDDDGALEAAEDPVYMARMLAGDWHPHWAQEVACLCPYYDHEGQVGCSQGPGDVHI